MPAPDIILPFLLTAVAAYIIGSVDFSIIVTRLFARTDVRHHGSGNAGATNVLRTAGKLPAALTFAGDFFKCVMAVLFGRWVFSWFGTVAIVPIFVTMTAGLACVIGHIFPIFFGFRGGKGVAASAALVLMVDWKCFIVVILFFILMVILTRIVSLSALMAVTVLPVVAYLFLRKDDPAHALLDALLMISITVILYIMHHTNIMRLIHGTESRICSRSGRR